MGGVGEGGAVGDVAAGPDDVLGSGDAGAVCVAGSERGGADILGLDLDAGAVGSSGGEAVGSSGGDEVIDFGLGPMCDVGGGAQLDASEMFNLDIDLGPSGCVGSEMLEETPLALAPLESASQASIPEPENRSKQLADTIGSCNQLNKVSLIMFLVGRKSFFSRNVTFFPFHVDEVF